jgi:hypothetical protein
MTRLSREQEQALIAACVQSISCPASVNDIMVAFRLGAAVAIRWANERAFLVGEEPPPTEE